MIETYDDPRHEQLSRMPTHRSEHVLSDLLSLTRRVLPDATDVEVGRVLDVCGLAPVMMQTSALIILEQRGAPQAEREAIIATVHRMRHRERVAVGLEVDDDGDEDFYDEDHDGS